MDLRPDQTLIDRQHAVVLRLPGYVNPAIHRLFACLGTLPGQPQGGILEIGVFGGQSLLSLACAFGGRAAIGVDPFFDDFHNEMAHDGEDDAMQWLAKGRDGSQRQKDIFLRAKELESLGAPGLAGRVELAVTTQDKFLARSGMGPWAVAHLDGEHTFQAVAEALEHLEKLLLPGGILILDDFNNPAYPGITEALHVSPRYRQGLEPLIYGFGKGVFAWQWPAGRLADARKDLAEAWAAEADVAQYFGHDGAPVLHHRAVRPDHSSFPNKVRRRLHRLIDQLLG